MACTTILVGKAASYDGSTMIARNDDSGSGHFTAKKFTVIHPEELPKIYRSVLSHAEIPLPEGALRFTAMPNAVEGKGIWAASGVNAANVGMTATETITSNPSRAGRRPAGGVSARQGRKARGARRHRRGRYRLSGAALHPFCPRGRAASGQPAGTVRYLRNERHRFSGRKRDLVAGDHRRSPLDRPPRAGRCVCGHAQPTGHRHL